MINKKFLKTLTLLYVENDENIILSFTPILKSLFKEVYISENGKDALIQYHQVINNDKQIDIIISESKMKYISGIELLSKIRESNKNIPFIFFTEDNDIDLLLNSLKQNVTAYFRKPIKFTDVLEKVTDVCLVKKEEDQIIFSQKEVEDYLDVINNVAIVFIFDQNCKINYVNNFLTEIVKCEEDELIGEDYRVIFHHEISKNILEKQWNTLKKAQKWQGKIKYISKDSSAFYANSTIFPVMDIKKNTIRKYISINFLTTKEEQYKREYKKKVLYNLQETKKIYRIAQEKIDLLEEELLKFQDYKKTQDNLEKQKTYNRIQYDEIQKLENKIKNGNKKFEQLTFGVNEKVNKIASITTEMKLSESKSSKKIIRVSDEIKIREAYIERITKEIKEKSLKIKDLIDVDKHRTEQLLKQKKNSNV